MMYEHNSIHTFAGGPPLIKCTFAFWYCVYNIVRSAFHCLWIEFPVLLCVYVLNHLLVCGIQNSI